jgi:hypothetical protein
MSSAGIPLATPPLAVITRRLAHAYPTFKRGFEDDFALLDDWLHRFDNLVTFGRQGLYRTEGHREAQRRARFDCAAPM